MLHRLEIEGDAAAIGRALGYFSGPALHDHILKSDGFRLLAARAERAWLDRLEHHARTYAPAVMDELDAMAGTAEVPPRDLLLWQCRGDAPLEIDPAGMLENGEGCTSVACIDPASGQVVIGHNEDGDPGLHGRCALVTVRPAHGPAFASFLYPGSLPGHSFSINAAGLVHTVNNLRARERTAGMPRQILARSLLACETPEEAAGRIADMQRASGYHHMFAHPGGRPIAVEAPAGVAVHHVVEQAYAHANHMILPGTADLDQHTTASSASRQARADALLTGPRDDDSWSKGGSCTDLASRILADRDGAAGDGMLPIFRDAADDPDHENTLATMLASLTPEDGIQAHVRAPDGTILPFADDLAGPA